MSDGRRPWRWGRVVPIALGVAVMTGAAQEAVSGLLSGDRWNWPEMALRVVVTALLLPLVGWLPSQAVSRGWITPSPARRHEDHRRRLLEPVLADGRLPQGDDPQAWRRPLRDEARLLHGLCWVYWVVSALVAVLTAAAAIVANGGAWTVWAVALAVGLQGALVPWRSARKLHTARRLLAELPPSAQPSRG